jgi:cell division transport system permease protein
MLSTASIALVLFLLGIVGYVSFKTIKGVLDPSLRVTLTADISDNLWENEKQVILNSINSLEQTESVVFISKEERFNRSELPFEVDMELLGGENPLRDCYEVTLRSDYADAQHIDVVVEELSSIPGVEYVDRPSLEDVERSTQNILAISLILVVFSVALFIISILLLNNTLRLAIYSKRYLINTMKLVGATKWYIMRPLLISALKQGLLSGIIASAMMCAMIYGVVAILPIGVATITPVELAVMSGVITLIGVVITVAFSAMANNKFVNMKSNKIHLY